MKVVLLENLGKKGSIGDIIDVKRGFARNYLISSNKALYASKENIKEVEKIRYGKYIIIPRIHFRSCTTKARVECQAYK